jgi:hypothetical protein
MSIVRGMAAAEPATTSRGNRLGAALLLMLALISVIGLGVSMYDRALQDDAYISFVYARNFARGHGLVYNAGQPAVEGYTNFLWTWTTGLALRAGLSAEDFVQRFGLASALAAVIFTWLLARRLGVGPLLCSSAALLPAAMAPFVMEAVGGLETHLFTALLLAGLWLRWAPKGRWMLQIGAGLSLGLASWTRPEGLPFFVLLEFLCLLPGLRLKPVDRGGLLARVLPFMILVGGHLLWRHATYGGWLPNTFHAKVGGGLDAWIRGAQYVVHGISDFGILLFLLPYAVVWRSRWERPVLVTLGFSSAFVLYVIAIGGDFKPTLRYLLPVLPLWAILAAKSIQWIVEQLPAATRPQLAGALLMSLHAGLGFLPLLSSAWPEERVKRNRELQAVGEHLHQALPEDAWIAVSNAGAIPYFSDRRTLDMLGLNDAHIAHQPITDLAPNMSGHERGDGDYVLRRQPDAILFLRLEVTQGPLSQHKDRQRMIQDYAFGTSERQIVQDPRFGELYNLKSSPLPDNLGFVNYFLLKETAARMQE